MKKNTKCVIDKQLQQNARIKNVEVSNQQFSELINQAIERTPSMYKERLQNVAFILEDEPSPEQRKKMALRNDQTLLGLYEGVPLPARGGATKLLPDKITLFKKPLLAQSSNLDELRENVRHTVWHEIAHYFGLDHKRIYELDGSTSPVRAARAADSLRTQRHEEP